MWGQWHSPKDLESRLTTQSTQLEQLSHISTTVMENVIEELRKQMAELHDLLCSRLDSK